MRVARGDIHLVPPTETNQATTGDVFEIVEIRGEKEEGQDEDEDTVTVLACEHPRWVMEGDTYKSLMKRTPNKYIRRAPMRKARKQMRVMGWALRRQFRSPCCGCGGSMMCDEGNAQKYRNKPSLFLSTRPALDVEFQV